LRSLTDFFQNSFVSYLLLQKCEHLLCFVSRGAACKWRWVKSSVHREATTYWLFAFRWMLASTRCLHITRSVISWRWLWDEQKSRYDRVGKESLEMWQVW